MNGYLAITVNDISNFVIILLINQIASGVKGGRTERRTEGLTRSCPKKSKEKYRVAES